MAIKSPMIRIGSVSYLNAKPLIHGLEHHKDLQLELEVPSRLLAGLRDGRFDVALLPVVDYQRHPGLKLIPSGGIGSDGETLTVRIFSRQPIQKIQTLACDRDSHTSVALARVILAERYGIHPELVDWTLEDHDQPRLLIGDKVVNAAPTGFPYQLDLGAEWKALTGLPFVFAAWMARHDVHLGDLPQRLTRARLEGLACAPDLVARFARPSGWPDALALQYLTINLNYEIGPRQIQAINLFYDLAAKHGAIETPVRKINPDDHPLT
jgi:chorismate dehydratase